MVKLTSASLQSPSNGSSSLHLITNESIKKHSLKLKKDCEKNLDALTARELKERFGDFSYVDAYVKKMNGLSLFETIRNGKEVCLKNGTRLSSTWWSNLRLKWCRAINASALLVVKISSEVVPPPLVAALT